MSHFHALIADFVEKSMDPRCVKCGRLALTECKCEKRCEKHKQMHCPACDMAPKRERIN